MPKKRHQTRYSKPQSTAPASLLHSGVANWANNGLSQPGASFFSSRAAGSSSSSSSASHDESGRAHSVNQLLANLRRAGPRNETPQQAADRVQIAIAPSVPPVIRDMLQLPETPVPRSRTRVDPAGRRLPPGPAPPRSWLAQSRHAPRDGAIQSPQRQQRHGLLVDEFGLPALPGAYRPSPRSLIGIVLRHFTLDWDFQREYCQFCFYDLPTHLRAALIASLSGSPYRRLSIADLQALLLPPPADDLGQDETQTPATEDVSIVNADFSHLDLTGALGKSLKVRALASLLFPSTREDTGDSLRESWEDAPEPEPGSGFGAGGSSSGSVHRPLLPNLTHLSLALDPRTPSSAAAVSWRHLLALSTRLVKITHLSLAYWPVPTLTPNARFASVVSPEGRTVQFGGTGPYSHSLDDDWSEAVMVLRRLCRNCYGLEYLDLTGCMSWWLALAATAEHDAVDWVGQWGKVTTLVLHPGYTSGDDDSAVEAEKRRLATLTARRVEKYICAQRAGQGRFITVDTGGRTSETG